MQTGIASSGTRTTSAWSKVNATRTGDRRLHAEITRLGFFQGRQTTGLITHRLANVRRTDRIYVMHDGRLVDQGTHDELISHGDLYKTWYDLQRIGYLDD